MEMNFNVTGEKRKSLVQTISEITGEKERYLGIPSYGYQIGEILVDKVGTVTYEDEDKAALLLHALALKGFIPESTNEPQNENFELTVTVDRDALSDDEIERIKQLLSAKETLIKKALGLEQLPIEVTDEYVRFPWFLEKDLTTEEVYAYSHFISALCAMAKKQKRISGKEKALENEKYAFRCFLLRLGFIGDEYKSARKILLKNLEGSSAFKGGISVELSK